MALNLVSRRGPPATIAKGPISDTCPQVWASVHFPNFLWKFGSDSKGAPPCIFAKAEWALRRYALHIKFLGVTGCIFAVLMGDLDAWHWPQPVPQKLDQVSGVPAGVLRVISCVILTYTRTFSNREPIPFSKAHALSYTKKGMGSRTAKLGMIRCIFVEKWPLESEL